MSRRSWKIEFDIDDDDLITKLYNKDNVISTYDYYNFEEAEESIKKCIDQFKSALYTHEVNLTDAGAKDLVSAITEKFTEFAETDLYDDGDDDEWGWRSFTSYNNTKPQVIESIKKNKCSFAQYALDICFERIRRGQKRLIPGEDRIPKNLNFIDDSGDRYYARISSIRVLPNIKEKVVENAFEDDDDTLVIVAFELPNKDNILAFGLEFINDSTEERTIQFYSGKKNQVIEVKGIPCVLYSMSECKISIHSTSILSRYLSPALNYYSKQLEIINEKSEAIKMKINLNLLREYFDDFKNLVVDEDLMIVPILGKPTRLRSMSLIVDDYKGKNNKYDFYEGTVSPVSKEDEKGYIEYFNELNIPIPNGTEFAIIDLIELSENDSYLFKRVLLDSDSISCTIVNNIEGDRVRLKRIISGIENAMNGKVSNSKLVETICKNDINITFRQVKKYIRDTDYIDELKRNYPILSSNEEQLITIDKIMQMDDNDIDIMLIQGPPGTGKTELILALAKELSKANYNTLVTSNVHVACDNIVDRLKNNKDLVLKRYTSIRGEQYEKEIIKNKKIYVENQVLEGFKYKDIVIDSKDSYDKICSLVDEAKEHKQQILSTKETYDKDLEKYNSLLKEKEYLANNEINLNNEFDRVENAIEDIQIEKINSLKNLLILYLRRISKEKEIQEIDKKIKKQNLLFNEKSQVLNEMYDSVASKETIITNNEMELNSVKDELDKINDKLILLNKVNDFYTSLNYSDIKNELINNYCKNKIFNNNLFFELFNNTLENVSFLSEIYKKLNNDLSFVQDGRMSNQTMEFLLYQKDKNGVLGTLLDKNILNDLDEVYHYNTTSKFKRNIMAILPFIKVNGHNNSYYADCITRINKEFKKIQFYFEDYVMKLVNDDISNESLSQKKQDNENLIISCLEKVEECEIMMEELETAISSDNSTVLSIKKQITSKSKELLDVKNELEKLRKEKENLVNEYKFETTAIEKENNVLSGIANREEQLINKKDKLFEDINQLRIQINDIKTSIQIEYQKSEELINNYEMFINKMDIDLKNVNKQLELYQEVLSRIQLKIDYLVNNGWDNDSSLDFLFNYTKELEKIVDCDISKIDRYFNGRGNEFNQMFLLSEQSDGSLVSMTTNQIASLLNNSDNRDLNFDYAIIDEASKCRFEDIIISLPRVRHLVLIGDFMQLDPMYDRYANIDLVYQNMFTVDEWDSLNRSSFSLLLSQFIKYNEDHEIKSFDENPYVGVMKRQYRMNKGIFRLIEPVYSIHEGFELIDEKQMTANDVMCIDVPGNEIPSGTSQFNMEEGNAILSFLKTFQENRANYPNIKTIGVITGYKAQENYILRNLKPTKIPGMKIGTFDRFQGREFDLVIVSLVRTVKLGFTNNVRRMNVAFSRAKNHLLVFGNITELNKIAMRTTKFDDEYSNSNIKENTFVVKKLIPNLYKIRKDFISDKDRVNSIMDFLKENMYE